MVQAKDLHKAEKHVSEQRQLCEDLRAELSKTQHDLTNLHSTHGHHADNAQQQITKLEEELEAARQHVHQVEVNLEETLAKLATAADSTQSLNSFVEALQQQLHAGNQNIGSLISDLQAKVAAFDALTAEHQSSNDKCAELCSSLQQSEEALQAKTLQLEQAVAATEAEKNVKVDSDWNYGAGFVCSWQQDPLHDCACHHCMLRMKYLQ